MPKENNNSTKSIILRRRTEEALRKLAETPHEVALHDTCQLLEELALYQFELEMQNEQLRKAQAELEEARSRYADLYDFAPVGYFTFDRSGLILEANLTGADMLGVERGDLINKPFCHFVAPEYRDIFNSHRQAVSRVGQRQSCEIILVKRDGAQLHTLLDSIAVTDSEGRFSRCRTAVTDISSSKQTEEALQESQERFRHIFETAEDSIFVKDRDLRYIQVNPAMQRLFECPASELIGKTDYDLFGKGTGEQVRLADSRVLEGEVLKEEITKKVRGKPRVFSVVKKPVRDERGNIIGLFGIARDITERKKAEEELAREMKISAALAELSSALLKDAPIDEISHKVMEYAQRLTGSRFGFVGYIDPESGYLVCPTMTEDIMEECRVKNIDKGFRVYKEFRGLWGWVLKERKPLLSNNPAEDPRAVGVPEGHLPIERFLSVPALIGDSLVGQVAVANPESDYSERDMEVVERLAALYALAVNRKRTEEALQKVNDTLESRVKERTAELSKAIKKLRREVRERRRAQKELSQSEKQYRAIVEDQTEMICRSLPDGTLTFVNGAFSSFFGRKCGDLLGRNLMELFPDSERERLRKNLTSFRPEKPVVKVEQLMVSPAGEPRCHHWTHRGIFDHKGRLVEIQSVGHDITERKMMEQALRESEMKLESIIKTVPDIIYRLDPEGRITFISEAVKRYGYTPEELIGTHIFDLIHPEERERAVFRVNERRTGERRTRAFEIRLLVKGKGEVPFEIRAEDIFSEPVFLIDAEGIYTSADPQTKIFVGTQGIARDITERKRAEEALRNSRFRLAEAQRIAHLGSWEWEIARNEISCSDETYRIFGLTSQEFGKTYEDFLEFVHPEHRKKVERAVKRALSGEQPYDIDFRIIRKDGGERIVQAKAEVVFDPASGRAVRMIGTVQDITELKRTEQELREKQSRLETTLKYESLMADVASKLNSVEFLPELLNKVFEHIGQCMELSMVCFFQFDEACQKALKYQHWLSPRLAQSLELPQEIPTSRIPVFFQQIKAGRIFASSNVQALEAEERDFFTGYRRGAVLACPVALGGEVKGFISYVHSQEHRWEAEEVKLFRTITDMVANACERESYNQARLEAERRHTEAGRLVERASLLASIGTMTAGITHEINQSLNNIKLIADSVVMGVKREIVLPQTGMIDRFRQISQHVKRIDQIIRHMREFWVKPTQAREEDFDLNQVVAGAFSLLEQQLYSHGIECELALETHSLPVRGNPIHPEQIVINLVMNAMQALDDTEREDKKIRVSTAQVGNTAVLEIKDNGTGFAEGDEERLFDPFYSTKKPGEGTGLGLAIVKKCVEDLSGAIEARKNELGGATFTVKIPIIKES